MRPFSVISSTYMRWRVQKGGGAQILESNNDVMIIMNRHKKKNKKRGDLKSAKKSVIRQQLQLAVDQLKFSLT